MRGGVSAAGGGAAGVLIVDDEADARELVAGYLTDAGAEVRTAASAQEALEALENFTPDLIVLDLLMPVMDGPALFQLLRRTEAHQRTPVVVVTAKHLSAGEIKSLRRDVLQVLGKDAALEEGLRAAMQQVLGQSAGAETDSPNGKIESMTHKDNQ